jgi:phosphoglucosamine mutase
VYEQMLKNDYVLGGEQSGHIIFSNHLTTGDGLLTALKLLEVMIEQKQSLKDLSKELSIYPQVLKNVKVKDKKQAIQDESLKLAILKAEQKLEGNGRILVRPSGTEPLVRVMAEAKTIELCNALVDEISNKIEELGL